MEKILNVFKPGNGEENEILYGSGTSGKLQGEGSHLAEAKNATTSTGPAGTGLHGEGSHFSQVKNTATGTGPAGTGPASSEKTHMSDVASSNAPAITAGTAASTELASEQPANTSTLGSSNTPSHTTATNTGYGSTGSTRMPGSFESDNPYTSMPVDPRVSENAANTTTGPAATSKAGHDSHLGRDVGVGAAGAGLAEHEHKKHEGATTSAGLSADNNAPITAGPHKSDLLNKVDPRVDSDLSKSQGSTGVGKTSTTTAGPHDSNLLNKADPRVDSDLSKNQESTSLGHTSAATTTAGPHNSDLLNKADPRVDSDQSKSQDHHYGRDAAALGGATAVGAGIHEHNKKETEPIGSYYGGPSGSEVSGPHSTATANRLDPRINTSSPPIGSASTHDPVTGGGAESADIAHDTTTQSHTARAFPLSQIRRDDDTTGTATSGTEQSGHHLGRDAAVGAGAVGFAEHEHKKHEHGTGVSPSKEPYSATGDNTTGTTASSTEHSGHHLGRDAAVGAGTAAAAEHEHKKHGHGSGNDLLTGDKHRWGPGTTGGDNSKVGNTDFSGNTYPPGVSVAGAGTVGAPAPDAHHGHYNQEAPAPGTNSGYTSSNVVGGGPAPNTAGPHSKDWMNKLDPRVKSDPKTATPTGPTGSYATTQGAGIDHGVANRSVYSDPAARDNPGFVSKETHPTSATTTSTHDGASKDHHYGRDAAAAGAVGAGAYEADKHHEKHATGVSEPGHTTTAAAIGPATGHSAGITRRSDIDPSHTSTVGTTTGATDKDHHYGRDAAGAGVIGGAAYEAEKHHHNEKDEKAAEKAAEKAEKQHEKDMKAQEKHHEKEVKAAEKEAKKEHKSSSGGLFGFLHRDKDKKYTKEEEDEFDRQEREHNSHAGRDTAIGGAAVGGAAYEAEKHHGHHNTDTTTGPTATGASAATDKPLPLAPGTTAATSTTEGSHSIMDRGRHDYMDPITSTSGTHGTTATDPTATKEHHFGRDTAGVGAIGGAAAVAEHEHHKHEAGEKGVTTGTGPTSSTTGPTTTGSTTTGTGAHDHHLSRDATAVGGATALGAHEHDRHTGSTTTTGIADPTSTTKPHTWEGGEGTEYAPPGTTLGDKLHGVERNRGVPDDTMGTGNGTGRNKLHKDPPPGHPAAVAAATNAQAAETGTETGTTNTGL